MLSATKHDKTLPILVVTTHYCTSGLSQNNVEAQWIHVPLQILAYVLFHRTWEHKVIEQPNQDKPCQQDQRPAHVMANDLTLVAHELRG